MLHICAAGKEADGDGASKAEQAEEASSMSSRGNATAREAGSRANEEPSQAVDLSNLFAGVWMGDDDAEEAWSEAGEEGVPEAGMHGLQRSSLLHDVFMSCKCMCHHA